VITWEEHPIARRSRANDEEVRAATHPAGLPSMEPPLTGLSYRVSPRAGRRAGLEVVEKLLTTSILEVVEKLLTTSILAANRTALRAVKRSGNRRAMALELWAEAHLEQLIAPLGDR
jgi:hypothetical protein